MSEMTEDKKKTLKEMIRQLHLGAAPQAVKERFKQALANVSPLEISKVEQELVQEGMPREEIHRLCEVHMLVFQEQLEKQKPQVPSENPVHILMEEHKVMLQLVELATTIMNTLQKQNSIGNVSEEIAHLKHIGEDFADSEKHYLREENVLFPMLEKHGVTEPPAMMWTEHNRIRPEKKQFQSLVEKASSMDFEDFKAQMTETVELLKELLSSHFFKENNILFPTALRVFSDEEWNEVKKEFAQIGYCRFTPQHLIAVAVPTPPQVKRAEVKEAEPKAMPALEELLQFETGMVPKPEVEALLRTLPFDITFVDKEDTVRYFNKSEIFLRTKAVLGRKVQQCHPQKSIHIVNRILESFKSGRKDVAEFWINMDNKLIYIRYFPVRDTNGKYLGTVEVTQDVTDIKHIEGEKRLLDWKD